jgi:hypothetical protein
MKYHVFPSVVGKFKEKDAVDLLWWILGLPDSWQCSTYISGHHLFRSSWMASSHPPYTTQHNTLLHKTVATCNTFGCILRGSGCRGEKI